MLHHAALPLKLFAAPAATLAGVGMAQPIRAYFSVTALGDRHDGSSLLFLPGPPRRGHRGRISQAGSPTVLWTLGPPPGNTFLGGLRRCVSALTLRGDLSHWRRVRPPGRGPSDRPTGRPVWHPAHRKCSRASEVIKDALRDTVPLAEAPCLTRCPLQRHRVSSACTVRGGSVPPHTAVRVTFTVRPRTLARGTRSRESLSGPRPRVVAVT